MISDELILAGKLQLKKLQKKKPGRKAELGLVNILPWLFVDSLIKAIPVAGTLTAELATEIIENQVLPPLPCNSFLVADNGSIDNEVALCRILARKNITLVKVPAYSYDLNPIEMVFGLVKAIDLFSLYVLLPHFRPRDGTLENHCFQILKY